MTNTKKNAAPVEMTKCHGEAHTNAHVDGCMICAPYSWGFVPAKTPAQLKAERP